MTGGAAVADAVTGTNTEKIDALVAQVAGLRADTERQIGDLRTQVAELRAQMRLIVLLLTVSIPLLLSIVTATAYTALQVTTLTTEVRIMGTRLDRMEADQREFRDRLIKLEAGNKK